MIRSLLPLITAIFVLVFTSCTPSVDEPITGYANPELLIGAVDLESQLEDPNLLVIDARAGEPDTFIPGAVRFPANERLVDTEHPVVGYLVGPDAFEEMMQDLGLNGDDRAVIYDEGNGLSAARLFYALETYGFSNASILNGGIQAWQSENLQVTDESSGRSAGDFTADYRESNVCTFDYVVEASQSSDKVIFDVRSAGEYDGSVERAERNGHIPNAVNMEWSEVLEPEGVPYFLPAAQIQEKYDAMGITRDKEIIPHCQSNVRGAHAYFTLRLMGYDSVRPYEGSWAEYGNRSDAVVE